MNEVNDGAPWIEPPKLLIIAFIQFFPLCFGGDQIFDISKGIKEGNWNPNSRSTKSKSKEYRRRARPYSKNASIDFCEKLDKNLYWYLLDVKRYVDKAKVKAKQATQRKKS